MKFNLSQEFGGTFIGEDRPALSNGTGTRRRTRKDKRYTPALVAFSTEETREEDDRVNTDGRFRGPRRWFVPRPTETVSRYVGRGKKLRFVKRERFLRRNEAFSLPGGRTPLAELSYWDTETQPVFTPVDDRAKAIAELLTLKPYMAVTVYEKAMAIGHHDNLFFDERDDHTVSGDDVLVSLAAAMNLLTEEVRKKVLGFLANMPSQLARTVPDFLPKRALATAVMLTFNPTGVVALYERVNNEWVQSNRQLILAAMLEAVRLLSDEVRDRVLNHLKEVPQSRHTQLMRKALLQRNKPAA